MLSPFFAILVLFLSQPDTAVLPIQDRINDAIQWADKIEQGDNQSGNTGLLREGYAWVVLPVRDLSTLAKDKDADPKLNDSLLTEYLTRLVESDWVDPRYIMPAVIRASVFVDDPTARAELVYGAYLRTRFQPLRRSITDHLGAEHAVTLLDDFENNLKLRGLQRCSSPDLILAAAIGEGNIATRFESIRARLLEGEAEHNRRGQQLLFDLNRATRLLAARQDPVLLTELVVEIFIDGRFGSQIMWQLQELSREDPGRVPAVLAQLRAQGEAKVPAGGNPESRVQRLALYLHHIESWAVEAGFLEQDDWGDLQQHAPKWIAD